MRADDADSATNADGLCATDAVLDAYLGAFRAGDCGRARAVWTAEPAVGPSGDLCSATHLSAFSFEHQVAVPSADEVEYATTLHVDGSADGSVPSGEVIWFFVLGRQPSGAWRIVGAGSGP